MTTSIKVSKHGCVYVGRGCHIEAWKFREIAEARGFEVKTSFYDDGTACLHLFWDGEEPPQAGNEKEIL